MGDAFYYADEFNVSWLPTLRAMWSPVGQQVMIPTPGQPERRYGIGAVNYHTGETVVLFERRKRRREIAKLLEALVAKHPTGTIYVAWDNADTHQDDEVEAVVRAAAGRVVLLYLPTYSPWLNPIERRPDQCRSTTEWRQPTGIYHGGAPRPPARGPCRVGGPAVRPASRAPVGDRTARWQPSVRPRHLVYAACRVAGGAQRARERAG